MKKVLWITTYFPPRVNVAVVRNIKFLKYLPEFDCEVVVVCPKETIKETETSEQLTSQLSPQITVSKMFYDPLSYLQDRKAISTVARYLSYLMNNLFPPDGFIFWSFLVLFKINKIIKMYNPDLVYTTCNPYSINLIGAWLKFKYKLFWVTDFRDLWTLNPIPREHLRRYNNYVSKILEYRYLRYCDGLIANTDASKCRMIEMYKFLKNKIWVIPNGFDIEDMQNNKIEPIKNSLFFSGSIYNHTYTPLPILKLIKRLEDTSFLDDTWELHYAGESGETFLRLVQETGITMSRINHGYLNQMNLYNLINNMEFVLLCLPDDVNTSSWIPARLYDYIGCKSKIICLASRKSEVPTVIKQYGNGIVLYHDENINVRIDKLVRYISKPKSKRVDNNSIMLFSRKEITRKLANVFHEISKEQF